MSHIDAPTSPTTDPAKTVPRADVPATEYVVLTKQEGEGWKTIIPPVEARSGEQAVRIASNGAPGTYVAVPARSWKPVKVSVETVKRVTLEDV